jgi:hypothetical protein
MGFTKSRLLIRWLDPSTRQIKHAYAIQFNEHCTPTSIDDHIAPGSFLLSTTPPPLLNLPEVSIDISDCPSFTSHIFTLHITIPPKGHPLGCTIMTCTYYHLLYIHQLTKGSTLATHLAQQGPHNATFWLLSINHQEFSTAEQAAKFISSLQLPSTSTTVPFILAHRQSTERTSLADNRALFNQIRLSYHPDPLPDPSSNPIIAPVGCKVISLPTHPIAPEHIGKLSSNLHAPDWKEANFENYQKMHNTGTWSAPHLRSSVPPGKSVLNPCISFHVKDTATPHVYKLQGHTCADGNKQRQFVDFIDSYSPVGTIDSIRPLLAIAASKYLTISVLNITNAFQSSVPFDPDE